MQQTFFRKEYFGGLLYTQNLPGAIPIEEPHWSLLTNTGDLEGTQRLRRALEQDDAGRLRKHVDDSVRFGALDQGLHLQCEVFSSTYPLVTGVLSAPLRVYLHITDRCDLQCQHCMFACGNNGSITPELSTSKILQMLQILRDVRCPELRITGGEPTVRDDVPGIMAEAKTAGFYVMLNTNGVFCQTIRDRLVEAAPDEFIFSLDGRPEAHDRIRGNGSFARLDDNLRFFSALRRGAAARPMLTVNFTFGRHNRADLSWVVHYAASLGVHVNLMPLRPYGAARANLSAEMLTPQEFLGLTREVQQLRAIPEVSASEIRIIHKNFDLKGPLNDCRGLPPPFDRSSCGASSFGLGINPDGRVNACGFLARDERFIGPNLLTTPFPSVWYSPTIHAFRTTVKIGCESCTFYRRQCTGACKAMGIAAADGDINGLCSPDPYCYAHQSATCEENLS